MGLLARVAGAFRRPPPPPPSYDPADPSLVVLAESFDPAVADSAVLREAAERGVDLDRHVLVRHRVVGLTGDADAFAEQLEEGYQVVWGWPDGAPLAALVCRTERVTAMSLAQERSRMAGLAQRHGGDVGGYDLLAPPPEGPSSVESRA